MTLITVGMGRKREGLTNSGIEMVGASISELGGCRKAEEALRCAEMESNSGLFSLVSNTSFPPALPSSASILKGLGPGMFTGGEFIEVHV